MPKKATTAQPDEGQKNPTLVMGKTKLKTLLEVGQETDEEAASARGTYGEAVKAAIKDDHCHPGALRMMRTLKKIKKATKRDEHLFHLLAYLRHMGWDKVDDLFEDRQAALDAGEPAATEAADASVDAAPADDEDVRPRHMRQPGASAADDTTKH